MSDYCEECALARCDAYPGECPREFEVLDESRERAERIQSDHHLADLARAYCAAWQSNKDAEPRDWESRRATLDVTLYDLLVACGFAVDA